MNLSNLSLTSALGNPWERRIWQGKTVHGHYKWNELRMQDPSKIYAQAQARRSLRQHAQARLARDRVVEKVKGQS